MTDDTIWTVAGNVLRYGDGAADTLTYADAAVLARLAAAHNARLAGAEQDAARRDDVMRAGDLTHARMAALYEACDVFAQFALSYDRDSALALAQPTFYGLLRVYGKNAQAAVDAVRTEADAFVAELAAARAVVAVARRSLATAFTSDRSKLADALAAYDQAVKE